MDKNNTCMVPAVEILDVATILEEHYAMGQLSEELATPELAMRWLARRRLLRNGVMCVKCNTPCRLQLYTKSQDGKRWSCGRCRRKKSIRDSSFFEKSKLTLKQIVLFIYCWALNYQQHQCAHEANLGRWHTSVDWANYCREECEIHLERHASEIGGLDENGVPLIVEIYESKYFHRKYQQGLWKNTHWVLAGVERRSGKSFLVEVPNRKAKTLEALIQKYILPGSHIVSDSWATYANVTEINNGVYAHSIVPHNEHFVNPHDQDVNTLRAENAWLKAKRNIRRQWGPSRELFFHELLYRSGCPNRKVFQSFLLTLAENYPAA